MRLIPTMLKHFKGVTFAPNTVFFEYARELYTIHEVSDRNLSYSNPPQYNHHGEKNRGTLSDKSSYPITAITLKKTIFGHKIVFKINS